MKKIYFRILISTLLGAVLGIFCIIGVNTRLPDFPVPNIAIYLTAAWYNRLIMGIMVGLAGSFHFLNEKYHVIESILRGIVIGALVSISFSFLHQNISWTYFLAGTFYGLVIDLISTLIVKKIGKE